MQSLTYFISHKKLTGFANIFLAPPVLCCPQFQLYLLSVDVCSGTQTHFPHNADPNPHMFSLISCLWLLCLTFRGFDSSPHAAPHTFEAGPQINYITCVQSIFCLLLNIIFVFVLILGRKPYICHTSYIQGLAQLIWVSSLC